MDARVQVRLALEHARVVHQIPCRERIGAVEDDVVVGNDAARVVARERRLPHLEAYVRIERFETRARGVRLGAPDRRGVMQHLTLQVVYRDGVEVEQAESADAGAGEIECGGRAESPESDDKRR